MKKLGFRMKFRLSPGYFQAFLGIFASLWASWVGGMGEAPGEETPLCHQVITENGSLETRVEASKMITSCACVLVRRPMGV